MSRKLAFTFLSTLLLFVLTACAPDSLYGNMQVTLAPGEATRVVVVLSASAVKDSLLEFDVLHDAPAARVRIVPDDELLPIVELEPNELAVPYSDVAARCQREGDCSLGFTLDVLEADGPLTLDLRAYASRMKRYADGASLEVRHAE